MTTAVALDALRIAQVATMLHPEAGGPAYSIPMLCESLARHTPDVDLYALEGAEPRERAFRLHEFSSWDFPRRLGISPAFRRALGDAARTADIMHTHGLWMMPNVYPARATLETDCKLVVSPRGTLSKWAFARSRWRKRVMWASGQRAVLDRADCFHATAEHEYEDIRRMGFRAPVAVIPNGVDIPDAVDARPSHATERTLLFLGRVHPTKGLDLLVRAWARVQSRFPQWTLRIAGPEELGFRGELEALGGALGCERVAFAGPAFGAAKDTAFAAADLFVLPSHTENFGMSIAEALAHAVPVITTQGTPWSGLRDRDCGWWIELSIDSLAATLTEAMALADEERVAKGQTGRDWVATDFSWSRIGDDMHQTYGWLLDAADRPDCVRID